MQIVTVKKRGDVFHFFIIHERSIQTKLMRLSMQMVAVKKRGDVFHFL